MIPNDKPHTIFRSVSEIWRHYPIWLASILIGGVVYLLGVFSHHTFAFFTSMCERYPWWPFLTLPAGGIALTWFMRFIGPGTEGSGIQQAVAAIHIARHEPQINTLINLKLAAAKFFAIVVGMGSGFVLGLEGPSVQISASIMYSLRKLYRFRNPSLLGQLIMAGGAAGIAAAFSAPMAGLMFAFEELGSTVSWHASARVMLSVILAGTVAFSLRGNVTFFEGVEFYRHADARLIAILLAVTVVSALAGCAFVWLAIRTNRWMPTSWIRFRTVHPYYFAIMCCILIAAIGMVSPIFGSGVEKTQEALSAEYVFPWHFAPLKLIGLVLTMLVNVPGGIFSPSLSIGAGVGCWFSSFGDAAWHTDIIAIAMAACLAAVTRAPLTAAVIITEMTGGHEVLLFAMGASLLAAYIARFTHIRFYHQLAGRILKNISKEISAPNRLSRRLSRRLVKR